ncbi:hypothetical protein F2P56_010755 [Juglans regia]|uniref:AP-3 complex subunit delta-1-like isoform X1 n=2 Tax=Juglans regia TaxID=51240 RepID=A0A2I4H160_JUGRE|nr:AP-3 complex subunit delta-1-like isoform X1 [Juglans regia]XP_018849872.2 AP-3 complex subunit delta-1-like isoform X1 [Juglans regia]XP_018849873.2 AP-3 complex subunit delta-1-like isoform X1 [Juglans regia]KAF5470230.1 hypothetical protein F2P56_010755 [Juglans regia]
MSRCFPFPPPGYEKRARIDDTDLLTKEKRKEKKHKKDKKGSRKREGKEKDNEKNKEKHSDKKDQKQKHKDKYRDRDKVKNLTSDEKSVSGQPESYRGERPAHNLPNGEIKHVQELARRIKDEERATENQMVQKITVTGQRKSEFPSRVVEGNVAHWDEGKGKTKEEKENGWKANGQRNHVDTKSLENGIDENLSVLYHRKVEGIAKPMEKNVEKLKDGKEKNKHKKSKVDKPRDKDREKKSKSKDKNRAKEKKREEKVKEISEQSKQLPKLEDSDSLDSCNAKPSDLPGMMGKSSFGEGNLGKRKEFVKNGLTLDNGIRPQKLLRPVCSSHPVLENGRKLEPCQTTSQVTCERQGGTNNLLLDIKEHKSNGLVELQRPNACSARSSSALKVYENGEASTKPPLVGTQRPNACSISPSPPVQVLNNGGAPTKSPHSDSKYLIQILSIPKMEEWSDIGDQEWLFGGNCLQSEKPKAGSLRGSLQVEEAHVWAEALQMGSADVYALPYVIPY